jgi:hypothetical protein
LISFGFLLACIFRKFFCHPLLRQVADYATVSVIGAASLLLQPRGMTMQKFIFEYAQFRNRQFVGWIEVGILTAQEVADTCKSHGFRKEDRGDTWMATRVSDEPYFS